MSKKDSVVKYRFLWCIGTALSFMLYFSGIVVFYLFLRKKIFKQFRTIVLTYHRIRDDGKDPDISVSVKGFKKQMTYLRSCFNVVSLNTLVNDIKSAPNMLKDNVSITFDDGYRDVFLNAYPVLRTHEMPAAIFLISRLIGMNEEMLNIEDIRIMEEDRIDFGSHTYTHRILTDIELNTAEEEINRSRRDLESLFGKKAYFFAYPSGKRGHYNEQLKNLVKKAGYKAAFTTENGEIEPDSDLFELKRIGIRECPLFVFKTRVSGIFENNPVYFIRRLLRFM